MPRNHPWINLRRTEWQTDDVNIIRLIDNCRKNWGIDPQAPSAISHLGAHKNEQISGSAIRLTCESHDVKPAMDLIDILNHAEPCYVRESCSRSNSLCHQVQVQMVDTQLHSELRSQESMFLSLSGTHLRQRAWILRIFGVRYTEATSTDVPSYSVERTGDHVDIWMCNIQWNGYALKIVIISLFPWLLRRNYLTTLDKWVSSIFQRNIMERGTIVGHQILAKSCPNELPIVAINRAAWLVARFPYYYSRNVTTWCAGSPDDCYMESIIFFCHMANVLEFLQKLIISC